MTRWRALLTIAALLAVLCLPWSVSAAVADPGVVRFGLVADIHQDLVPDAPARLRAFVDAMNRAKVDFICQLGDFCTPRERNREFLALFDGFRGPRYHVLGNHDMDGGYSRDDTAAFYGMKAKHYSFDCRGVHFVVLDGNERGGKLRGYPRYASQKQLDWLAADLDATRLPTIVFSHQALDDSSAGLENARSVRRVLEEANRKANRPKVVACFCGHHHDDRMTRMGGIHYIHVNSASYCWLGGRFQHKSCSDDVHRKFPSMKYTAPYEEPLWALVEIDVSQGRLTVKGLTTDWVGPSPWQLGALEKEFDPKVVAPRVSDRRIPCPK